MSITDHPSYTHSRRPEVVQRRSADADERPSVGSPSHEFTESSTAGFLIARPWWDPDLAVNGHPLDDPYVEMFWLGVLGPSTTCLLRRLARGFAKYPNGFRISIPDTARAMGLGTGTGRNGPLNRTIDRACTFHLVRRPARGEIDVRLHVPSLTRRQLSRLPLSIRNSHRDWMSAHPELDRHPPSGSQPQQHAVAVHDSAA